MNSKLSYLLIGILIGAFLTAVFATMDNHIKKIKDADKDKKIDSLQNELRQLKPITTSGMCAGC